MPVVQYKYNASMNLWQFIKDFGSTLLYNPNDYAAGVRIGLELPEKYTVKAVKAIGNGIVKAVKGITGFVSGLFSRKNKE